MLYWGLSLSQIHTKTLKSFKGTVYNSLFNFYTNIIKKPQKRFIVLSYETEIEDSITFQELKYKVQTKKEICNKNKLYPESFNCNQRCKVAESIYKASVVDFLSFRFFKNPKSEYQSNSFYK